MTTFLVSVNGRDSDGNLVLKPIQGFTLSLLPERGSHSCNGTFSSHLNERNFKVFLSFYPHRKLSPVEERKVRLTKNPYSFKSYGFAVFGHARDVVVT